MKQLIWILLAVSASAQTYTHPFASTSPWNTPVANLSGASYSSVGTQLSGNVNNPILSDWLQFSTAIYQAKSTDPVTTLYYNVNAENNLVNGTWKSSGNSPTVEAAIIASSDQTWGGFGCNFYSTTDVTGATYACPSSFHSRANYYWSNTANLPTGALPAPGASAHMAVWQPNGWVLETFGTIILSNGNVVAVAASYSWPNSNGTGYQSGRRATMLPNYAGLMRQGESTAGGFNHALGLVLPPQAEHQAIAWPATTVDRSNFYTGTTIPMGGLLAIPAGTTNAALGITTTVGAQIANAMRTYGGYVTDTAGTNVFEFLEDSNATDLPAYSGPLAADLQAIVNSLQLVTFTPGTDSSPQQYFLANASTSPAGNDSNSGTDAAHPWLTPNHSLNCGDFIQAASSSAYSASNFDQTHWGTVACPLQNNVAWLTCAVFDTCKITSLSNGQNGMEVHASYWGVQGWEIDGNNAASGMCFFGGWANIRNIIFANDIATGCGLAGFEFGNYGAAGPDYFALLSDIAYNSTGGSVSCGSGVEIIQPVAQDTLPGTHIYSSGIFAWHNINGNPCGGTPPTDGEGLNYDTFDGRLSSISPYTPQAVATNSILVGNGGRGFEVEDNLQGAPNNSHVYVNHLTAWGNNTDLNQTNNIRACTIAEILGVNFEYVSMEKNLIATAAATGVNSYPIYDYWATTPDASDRIWTSVGWSATGTYSAKYDPGAVFSYGPNNLFGTNPQFANPTIPGAPSCGSAT